MDIVKILIFFVIIAAIAVLIAVVGTYWYLFVGAGLIGFGIYYFTKKKSDEGNKV